VDLKYALELRLQDPVTADQPLEELLKLEAKGFPMTWVRKLATVRSVLLATW
jgi:hypothetical protein